MHPCLRLAEIVEIIFEMLDDDRRYLGTAAALARTCRLFQDLALNIVWAFQDSLRNLLERFPEEIWRYHDRTDGLIRIGFVSYIHNLQVVCLSEVTSHKF